MGILPEGEQFTGTRGGAMDHAVVLAARAGHALVIQFAPLSFRPIGIPQDWCFLVAHSLTHAEKSGAARAEYNAKRSAGTRALERLGFDSYRSALEHRAFDEKRLGPDELRAFLHVTSEAQRVEDAVLALRRGDIKAFGKLLTASHASLGDQLQVSTQAIDQLVEAAMNAGALGARLTGAGFGGCVVVLCRERDRERTLQGLRRDFYASRAGFDPQNHIFVAEASAGALYDTRMPSLHMGEAGNSRDGQPVLY